MYFWLVYIRNESLLRSELDLFVLLLHMLRRVIRNPTDIYELQLHSTTNRPEVRRVQHSRIKAMSIQYTPASATTRVVQM